MSRNFFRRRYGSGPLHLIAHLAAFAIAAYALAQVINGGRAVNFIVWFAGAAVLHDLIFVPVYSGLDRIAHGPLAAGSRVDDRAVRAVPVVNHVRAPGVISGVLLLVYFPLILGSAATAHLRDTGHHLDGYLRNWLLITAALYGASAIIYAVRLRGHRRAP